MRVQDVTRAITSAMAIFRSEPGGVEVANPAHSRPVVYYGPPPTPRI